MTLFNYINHISALMSAVCANLNFKLRALRIAPSIVIKNVSYHQLIPIQMYSALFQTYYEKTPLHEARWVM
jgi:hypothetical protein